MSEIKEIIVQYNGEVERGRKSWPKSIKSRVTELNTLGFNWKKISDLTGVPYYTILNWRHSDRQARRRLAEFKPVSVNVPTQRQQEAMLTVMVADRIKIEGMGYPELAKLLKQVLK